MLEAAILLIIFVIVGLSFSALGIVRVAALRIECTQRLRQIGSACKEYEDKHGHFPADKLPGIGAFVPVGNARLFRPCRRVHRQACPRCCAFLCPGRRTAQELGAQTGPSDYGCGKSSREISIRTGWPGDRDQDHDLEHRRHLEQVAGRSPGRAPV